jgi:hypothetical protein
VLFMTVVIKLRVSASSPAAALRLLTKCLQQQQPPCQHAAAAASAPPQAELLAAEDFAHPPEAHHPGLPFGDHRSLVGFFRSQGSTGMRRIWDKIKPNTGGRAPYAFIHPTPCARLCAGGCCTTHSMMLQQLRGSLPAHQCEGMECQLT